LKVFIDIVKMLASEGKQTNDWALEKYQSPKYAQRQKVLVFI